MDYLKFILASKMGPGPLHGQPFGKVSDKWQLEDYEGVLAHKYSLIIRGRNHDKTGKLARLARARLILSKEQEQIYAVARDRDQIEILKDDIDRMNQEDTRTRTLVKSTRDEIVLKHSPKSRIRFLPHDAPSAYGLRPSMIICDEMATWAKPDLWRALWTATGKNPRCTVAIISVPPPLGMGILSELMELAKDDPEWFFLLASRRGRLLDYRVLGCPNGKEFTNLSLLFPAADLRNPDSRRWGLVELRRD